jgi:hypothetical protein
MTSKSDSSDTKLTDFQKGLHTALGNEDVQSDFMTTVNKKSFYTPKEVIIKPNVTGDKLVFPFDCKYHYLSQAYLEQKWPSVTVKDKDYRIAWTHNMAMAPINKATFMAGSEQLQQFDRTWYEIVSQLGIRRGFIDIYDILTGNCASMQNWSYNLTSYTTSLLQPFIFNNNLTPFPLFTFLDNKDGVVLEIIVDLDITKYLRMQKKDGDEWMDIPLDISKVTISGKKSGDNKLDVPELRVKYASISAQEMEYITSCKEEKIIKYLYDDIISLSEENPGPLGRTAQFKIENPGPCRCFYFLVENLNSHKFNLYGNYTTNDNDITGNDPIASVSLTYGGRDVVYNKTPATVFSYQQVYSYARCQPRDEGYHLCAYGYRSQKANDVGVDYSRKPAHLSIHLCAEENKSNISIRTDNKEEGGFACRVYLVITRMVQFIYDEKSKKWTMENE